MIGMTFFSFGNPNFAKAATEEDQPVVEEASPTNGSANNSASSVENSANGSTASQGDQSAQSTAASSASAVATSAVSAVSSSVSTTQTLTIHASAENPATPANSSVNTKATSAASSVNSNFQAATLMESKVTEQAPTLNNPGQSGIIDWDPGFLGNPTFTNNKYAGGGLYINGSNLFPKISDVAPIHVDQLPAGYSVQLTWDKDYSNSLKDGNYIYAVMDGKVLHNGTQVGKTKQWEFLVLGNKTTWATVFNDTNEKASQAVTHALQDNSVPNGDEQLAASPDMMTKIVIGDMVFTGANLAKDGILTNVVWTQPHNTPAASDGSEAWTPTAGIAFLFSNDPSTGKPSQSKQFNIPTTIVSALGTEASFATTNGGNTWQTVTDNNANEAIRNKNSLTNYKGLGVDFQPTYTWLDDVDPSTYVKRGMTADQIKQAHGFKSSLTAGEHALYVLVQYHANYYNADAIPGDSGSLKKYTRDDGYQIIKVTVKALKDIVKVNGTAADIHVGQPASDFDNSSAADYITATYTDFDGSTKTLKIDPSQFGHNDYPIKSIAWNQKPGTGTDKTKASIDVDFGDGSKDVGVTVTLRGAKADGPRNVNGGQIIDNSSNSAISAESAINHSEIDVSNGSPNWAPTYEWVTDASGDHAINGTTYNYDTTWSKTHTSFTGYVKVSYFKIDKDGNLMKDDQGNNIPDGYQIIPVTINIQSEADQYGQKIKDAIDHMNSHTIGTYGSYNNATTGQDAGKVTSITGQSQAESDIAAADPSYTDTWGVNIDEIVWKSGVTQDQIKLYKRIVDKFAINGAHSLLPKLDWPKDDGTGHWSYVKDQPTMTITFNDGSVINNFQLDKPGQTTKGIQVYYPTVNTKANKTFVAGDIGSFNTTTAQAQLGDLGRTALSTYGQAIQWVAKNTGSETTLSFTDEAGKTMLVTGYHALTKDDINKNGEKELYVLIHYTKHRNDGDYNDGYLLVPVKVNLEAGMWITPDSESKQPFDNQPVNIVEKLNDGITKLQPSDDSKETITIPSGLTDKDVEWVDDNDQPLNAVPIYAGTYHFKFTTQGFNKLKAANPGKSLTNTKLAYTIEPADITGDLSGSNQRVYDGKPTTFDQVTAGGDIKVTLTFPGSTDATKTYTLQNGDVSWYTKDEHGNYIPFTNNTGTSETFSPTNVGTYYIKLNQTGKQRIADWLTSKLSAGLNKSLQIHLTDGEGSFNADDYAEFKITPASRIVVHYRDVNGEIEPAAGWTPTSGTALNDHTSNVDGTAGDTLNLSSGWDFTAANYVLAGQSGANTFPANGTLSADGNYYVTDYYVYLTHKETTVDGSKPSTVPTGEDAEKLGLVKNITRTINDNIPGNHKTVTQNVTYTRTATYDWVDKTIVANSYSKDWTLESNGWKEYKPAIKNPQFYDITITDGDGNSESFPNKVIPAVSDDQFNINTPNQTININYQEVMHFSVTIRDDTTGEDIYSTDIIKPTNGGWSGIDQGFKDTTGHNASDYQSVSLDGEPAGVDWNDHTKSVNMFASDNWQPFTDPNTKWWNPNYKWDESDTSVMMGRSFTIHVIHKLKDVKVSGTDSKMYHGQPGNFTGTLSLSATDAVTGQSVTVDYSSLKDSDLVWSNGASAPKDTGIYGLSLKTGTDGKIDSAILQALQKANPKYGFDSIASDVTYKITPAARVIVHYYNVTGKSSNTDTSDEITGTTTNVDGEPNKDFTFNPNPTSGSWDTTKNGWDWKTNGWTYVGSSTLAKFPSSNQNGNYYETSYNVFLKVPDNETTRTITQDIQYVDGFGNKINNVTLPASTTITLKRAAIIDNQGKITGYSDWTLGGSNTFNHTFTPTITTTDGQTYTLVPNAANGTSGSRFNISVDSGHDSTIQSAIKHLYSWDKDTNTLSINLSDASDLATLASASTITVQAPYLLNKTPKVAGSDSKPYDGQPASFNGSISWSNDSGLTIPSTITAADFDWYKGNTKLDSAPTNAGNYTLKLSPDGLKKLQALTLSTTFRSTVIWIMLLRRRLLLNM